MSMSAMWCAPFTALVFLSALARADEAGDWKARMQAGSAAMDKGDMESASREYAAAVKIAKASFGEGDDRLFYNLEILGRAYALSFQYELAVITYMESVSLGEDKLGMEATELITSLKGLGEVLRGLERPDEAAEHFRRGVAILEKAGGKDHLETGHLLAGLGE